MSNQSERMIHSRRKKSRRRILAAAIISALIFGLAAFWHYLNMPPEIPDPSPSPAAHPSEPPAQTAAETDAGALLPADSARKPGVYTFLIAGTNDDYNTDTIMLAAFDSKSGKFNVISIPRDTMVDVRATNKKINNCYGRGGINALCDAVGGITGIDPDYYCVVNLESFIEIVDLVGGVEFDVPYKMKHEDSDSKYAIHIEKGLQVLDGKKALQLVRYRGTKMADLGRIELQKDFLFALGKKAMGSLSLPKIAEIVPVVLKSLKTDLSAKDMLWFAGKFKETFENEDNVAFYTMPVKATGIYREQDYVYLDRKKSAELVNKTVNPFRTDIEESRLNIIRLQD